MKSSTRRRVRLTRRAVLAALALLIVPAFAMSPRAEAQDAGQPSVKITRPAPTGGGPDVLDTIAGTASGPGLTGLRVVIYALTDTLYVQPYVDSPYTEIGPDGRWETDIHLGRRYAALLVRPSYRPPATLAALPRLSGDVLAIHQVAARGEE